MDILTLFSLLCAGLGWLALDAHRQRVAGRSFSRAYRALLWTAAAFCGLIGLVTGAFAVFVALESPANRGFDGILLLFLPLICLTALCGALAFVWYARYRPQPSARRQPPLSA